MFTERSATSLGCLPLIAELHQAEVHGFYHCHSVRLRTRVMRNPMNRDERPDWPGA